MYRCVQALSDALGIGKNSVYQSLHKYGHAENCGIPKGVRKGSGMVNHRKPVTVGPHHWPSISAMARDLGVDRSHLGKMLKHEPDRVLSLVMRIKG